MSVERITRGGGESKTRGRYDYLLDNPDNVNGAQNSGSRMDPAQLKTFLEGINNYYGELEKLDLPPEYLKGVGEVIDAQVSQAFGIKVRGDSGEKAGSGENVKKVVLEKTPDIIAEKVVHPDLIKGKVHNFGKVPPGMPEDLWDICKTVGIKTGVDPYMLAAQMEKESQYGRALPGSPSAADGLMQVEPSTRAAYAAKFKETMGHAYDHASKSDQVAMAAVIIASKGGSALEALQKYNGGDNWKPGTTDSYGRPIEAAEYATKVLKRAEDMKAGSV